MPAVRCVVWRWSNRSFWLVVWFLLAWDRVLSSEQEKRGEQRLPPLESTSHAICGGFGRDAELRLVGLG